MTATLEKAKELIHKGATGAVNGDGMERSTHGVKDVTKPGAGSGKLMLDYIKGCRCVLWELLLLQATPGPAPRRCGQLWSMGARRSSGTPT